MLDLDVYLLAWEFYTLEAISVMLGRSEYGDFQPMRHSHSRWYQDFQVQGKSRFALDCSHMCCCKARGAAD